MSPKSDPYGAIVMKQQGFGDSWRDKLGGHKEAEYSVECDHYLFLENYRTVSGLGNTAEQRVGMNRRR